MKTALADGHFQNGGDVVSTLQLRRKLANEMMDNTIGIDVNDVGRP